MTSLGRLTGWADPLSSLLDQFKGKTSPLDTNHHQAVQTFQATTNTLMGPTSGPAAFKGDAADKMRSSIQAVLQAEQSLESANVLGQADTACRTCSQQIGQALDTAAFAMIDEPTVDELLAQVTVFDAAHEGSAAVASIESTARGAYTHARTGSAAAQTQAGAALSTVNAFSIMADDIKLDVMNWNATIGSIGDDSSWQQWLQGVWSALSSGQGIIPTLLKDVEKEDWKAFGESVDKLTKPVAVLGFLIDFATGKVHDLPTFLSDAGGAALTLIPAVGLVATVAAIVSLTAQGVGWLQVQTGQKWMDGNPLDNAIGKALQQPGQGLSTGGSRINVGGVLDDIGRIAFDTLPPVMAYQGIVNNINMWQGKSNSDPLLGDVTQLGRDTLQTVEGVGQVAVNFVVGTVDDEIVNPLPIVPTIDPQNPQIKAAHLQMIQGINSVAGWITDKLNWSF